MYRLKKCPFCGATAVIKRQGDMYELWAGHTDKCYLHWFKHPKAFTREALEKKWNMRKGEADDKEYA